VLKSKIAEISTECRRMKVGTSVAFISFMQMFSKANGTRFAASAEANMALTLPDVLISS
jgi:hypothetical protein